MPELPEVETTGRGIAPHIVGKKIQTVMVRQRQLRWLIATDFENNLLNETIENVQRRAKYLLLKTQNGTLIIHLGMSGNLRIVTRSTPTNAHDHVDIVFDENTVLRFNDQRRFGALIWATGDILNHALLRDLEQTERLEQLRFLQHGFRVDVAVVDSTPVSVDTLSDLHRVRAAAPNHQ